MHYQLSDNLQQLSSNMQKEIFMGHLENIENNTYDFPHESVKGEILKEQELYEEIKVEKIGYHMKEATEISLQGSQLYMEINSFNLSNPISTHNHISCEVVECF